MLIDIHRHSLNSGEADIMLRNAFHDENIIWDNERFVSVGLHPWHVKSSTIKNDIRQVNEKAESEKVLAIGEAGLDKTISTDLEIQESAFLEQVEIAKSMDKPMIIHCVKSYSELLSVLKKTRHQKPWIIHWFNASPNMAADLIRKNCYLSFGVTLYKENSKGLSSFKEIPLERLFLETDDSRFTIKEIYYRAAELLNIPLPNLKQQIKNNFKNCFEIRI